jgi:hypothetical protein
MARILDPKEFVNLTIEEAKNRGYAVEDSTRHGRQINFGHKKLHEQHLLSLHPAILEPHANIPALIDDVAPGRSCTHKLMREIIRGLIGAG